MFFKKMKGVHGFIGVKSNSKTKAEFYADFETVEKNVKNLLTKKL